MLVVFAATALITGLVAGLPQHRGLRWVASVLLLGNAMAVVFEYETDVPQFAEIYYLPILLGTGLLVAYVARAASPLRYPVAAMVAGYAVLRLAIVAALVALGRSTPDLPLAVLGLGLIDLPVARPRQRYAAGAAGVAAIAWLAAATGVASQSPSAVAVTAIPVLIVAAIVLVADRQWWRRVPGAAAAIAVVALLPLTTAAPALAHDPGEGDPVVQAQLTGTSSGDRLLTLRAALPAGCAGVTPRAVLARRAGTTLTAPLRALPGCTFEGSLTVPTDGRWFTYIELQRGDEHLEGWLPLAAGQPEHHTAIRELYVPAEATATTRTGQYVAGAIIYAIGLGLLAAAIGLTARTPHRKPQST